LFGCFEAVESWEFGFQSQSAELALIHGHSGLVAVL
jgi:hypothetical protein